jgi:hypothetical protein
MSANGFPGKRIAAMRAGMRTMGFIAMLGRLRERR